MMMAMMITLTRVVSLEISGGKCPEINSNLCGNFREFVKEYLRFMHFNYNQMFSSPALQCDAVK